MAQSLCRGGNKGRTVRRSAELLYPSSSTRQSLSTRIRTPRKVEDSSACQRWHTALERRLDFIGTRRSTSISISSGSMDNEVVTIILLILSVINSSSRAGVREGFFCGGYRWGGRRSGSELRRGVTWTRSGTVSPTPLINLD
jgi:hypothetical protein